MTTLALPAAAEALESGVRSTFETLFGLQPALTPSPSALPGVLPTTCEANVLLGFAGDLSGQFMLGMSEAMACRLAGTLLMTEMEAFDEVVRSGVAELGNMVAGAFATTLAGHGARINITVPTVLSGRELRVSWPGLVVSEYAIALPFGTLKLTVGIKQNPA